MKLTPAGVLLQPDLAGAGLADLDLFIGQDFGTADLMNSDCRNHTRLHC